MTHVPEPTVVQQHEVPEPIRALSTLTPPDYADLFTLVTPEPTDVTPERWARVAFEDVAGLGGQFLWRVPLGLRLARRWRSSPTHIAGWRISGRGDGWIRVEARSWMLTGQLVVHVDGPNVSLATFLRYDRPVAARVWASLSPKHRNAAPGLLRDAEKALA